MPEERFETVYLDLDDVLDSYAEALGCTPEEARDQVRTQEGLESALAQPQHYAFYYKDDRALSDLSMQAAVLARGISENQPFVEGNKRTALVAMTTFLAYNGWTITASNNELFDWILDFSRGVLPSEIAERLRPRLRRRGR